MKKIKFIIMTGLLFLLMEAGMWKSSQWLHENKNNDSANLLEMVLDKLKEQDTEQIEEKIKETIFKEIENIESKEAVAAINELEELLEALEKNPEMKEFVADYPNKEKWIERKIELTKKEVGSDAPLFLQWDRRWGYSRYGNKMIAINGCGPTCLSMVYVGLRGDSKMNPQQMALFSEKCGYVTEGSGTDWGLMTDGAKALGLNAEEIALDENVMLNTLRSGCQIICSMRPGDFTTTGHFIVIYGEKDGKLLIHDPNSIERSEKEWEFEDMKGQIKNLWKYN